MKRILIILTIMMSWVLANEAEIVENYYQRLEQLSDKQIKIMIYSYQVGAEYNLGYSLAAIAWKESEFGTYLLNLGDGQYGSYGVYHVLLDYVAVRNKLKSNWERSRYAEKLVSNIELCAQEAISELLFWNKVYKGQKNALSKALASYNAGGKGINSPAGKIYAEDAMLRIKALQKYFKKHNILKLLKHK